MIYKKFRFTFKAFILAEFIMNFDALQILGIQCVVEGLSVVSSSFKSRLITNLL